MCSKLLLVFSCIIVVATSMRIARDVPTNSQPNTLTEFLDIAAKNLKEVENTILKTFGVENTEQLEKKVIEEGKKAASKIDEWAIDVKKQTESLKDNPTVKDIRESVDKVIEDLKAKNPDTVADVKGYLQKANEESEKVLTKLKTLGESQEAKNIKDLSEKLLDKAASTFKEISTQIQEEFQKK